MTLSPNVQIHQHGEDILTDLKQDGFNNVVLGKGRREVDAYKNYKLYSSGELIDDETLVDNYMQDGILHKIISIPAEDSLRCGFKIVNDDENFRDDDLQSLYEDLHLKETCIDAITWDRLFGGALLVFIVDDGGSLDEPLNEDAIRSISGIRCYDGASVIVQERDLDMSRLTYGQPILYSVQNEYGGSFAVHASRTVWLDGEPTPPYYRARLDYRGGRVLDRIKRDIMNYNITLRNVLMLVERASQGVLKFSGLTNVLQSPEGEDLIRKRIHQVDMSRSIDNTVVIDGEDDYQQYNISLGGLNTVIEEYQTALSAVSGIPTTVLFGKSPSGMNSTGKSDLENYYNMIGRIQETKLRPIILKLNNLIDLSSNLNIDIPDVYHIEFNPLWNLSDDEKANIDKIKADTNKSLADCVAELYSVGALTADEIRDYIASLGMYGLRNEENNEGSDS